MGNILGESKALNLLATAAESSLPSRKVTKSLTFSNTGTGNQALATVTGVVMVTVLAVCKTSLNASAASTLSVGVTSDTDAFIAVTGGSGIAAEELWHDASPDAKVEASTVLTKFVTSDDIVCTIASGTGVASGEIEFTFLWTPLTEDGEISAA